MRSERHIWCAFGFVCAVLIAGLVAGCDTADEGELAPVREFVPPEDDASPSVDGDGDGDGDGRPTPPTGDGDAVEVPAPGDAGQDPTPAECSAGVCWWSKEDDTGCLSAGMPTLDMAPKDTDDGDIGPLYLAWSRLWVGQSTVDGVEDDAAWEGFGFDLDGTCTNSGTCEQAEEGLVSCKAGGVQLPFDGATCRDNTFARNQPVVARVPELGEVFGLTEEAFNCSLHNGAYTQIIRITGYNGKLEDESVRVDFYASTGLVDPPSWSCPMEGYADKYPLWLASYAWYIDEHDLDGPIETPGTLPNSRRFSVDAYVHQGYLVAFQADDFLVHLPGDNAAFPGWGMIVQKGLVTGRLEKTQEGTWVINDGLMGGRMRGTDLLDSFRQIGVCPEGDLSATYRNIEQYVRDGSDLVADGTIDPEVPCDAMSLGVAFEARPITPGPVATSRPLLDCCEPDNFDSESCPVGCGDGRVVGNERCDIAIPAGEPGACPTACNTTDPCKPSMLMGEACAAQCVEVPITAVESGDMCCPAGANAVTDSDCQPVCGNAVVEGSETCDPPGSCPSEATCTSNDVCIVASITGDANQCTAECSVSTTTECADDDGCCPSNCTNADDNDCAEPSLCGNDTVDQGETCDGDCPASCDDGDACTMDSRMGMSSSCNVRCVNQTITACVDGDGCCRTPQCNANTDSDCGTSCPNGIVEEGEECDDNNDEPLDGCFDCKVETPEQQCNQIIMDNGTTSDACRACQCEHCSAEFLNCTNGPDADANRLCGDVIQCGASTGCSGSACLCGSQSIFSCPFFGGNGPCRGPIVAAGGTSDVFDLLDQQSDTNTPLGKANLVSECTVSNCEAECL